jgi:sulfatase maturation enzyme AslB (radical SAM superfamily)
MPRDAIQFRFVPTMRCNLRCSYCFLPHSTGSEPTMYDSIKPEKWIEGMRNFSGYDVEFYMWGGEPFCVDGTYDVVKGFAELEFVTWARIDTNLTFAKKIVSRCPTEKVKLLCSWHTETFDFNSVKSLTTMLNAQKMVGMVNFVASDASMSYLKENNLELDSVIQWFRDEGMFLNVAADFSKGNDPRYREFILRYMHPDDWAYIHGQRPCHGARCNAGETYFTVGMDGALTSCGRASRPLFGRGLRDKVLGNYFAGTIERKAQKCPQPQCLSIVSYSHREDNSFQWCRHLEDYVNRCVTHRCEMGLG